MLMVVFRVSPAPAFVVEEDILFGSFCINCPAVDCGRGGG